MDKQEFAQRFRFRLRGMVLEGFSTRREAPSELGMRMDGWNHEIERMLNEMYDCLQEPKREQGQAGSGPGITGNGANKPATGGTAGSRPQAGGAVADRPQQRISQPAVVKPSA